MRYPRLLIGTAIPLAVLGIHCVAGRFEAMPACAPSPARPAEAPGGEASGDGLSREVIARTVHRRERDIKRCYDLYLRAHPYEGDLVPRWLIGSDGHVVRVCLDRAQSSSDLPAEITACVEQRILAWKFAEPRGGGNVPVAFRWRLREHESDGGEEPSATVPQVPDAGEEPAVTVPQVPENERFGAGTQL